MLMRAKVFKVSLTIRTEEPEEFEEDDNEEVVEVGYWVGDEEAGDQIKLDGDTLYDGMHPQLAIAVAKMMLKVEKWSRTKVGKRDIARMRAKVQKAMAA